MKLHFSRSRDNITVTCPGLSDEAFYSIYCIPFKLLLWLSYRKAFAFKGTLMEMIAARKFQIAEEMKGEPLFVGGSAMTGAVDVSAASFIIYSPFVSFRAVANH